MTTSEICYKPIFFHRHIWTIETSDITNCNMSKLLDLDFSFNFSFIFFSKPLPQVFWILSIVPGYSLG